MKTHCGMTCSLISLPISTRNRTRKRDNTNSSSVVSGDSLPLCSWDGPAVWSMDSTSVATGISLVTVSMSEGGSPASKLFMWAPLQYLHIPDIWYYLQIGHKLQVRKNDVQISSLWVSFFHIPYSSTLRHVTRLTTIRYIISLHDDAKCNNELPAPTGTTVFHFALTSRAIFRFTPLSTLPLRFPWRGCWHLVEGLNLTPSRARCLGHTVE